MMKYLALLTVFLSICFSTQAQTKEALININASWTKFYKAFETLDVTLLKEVHSKDLVRVSGGRRILDFETYMKGYEDSFKMAKAQNSSRHITLRFFERLVNKDTASERGIYKLIVDKDKATEQAYYGQFHVLWKKRDGVWNIIMDYDSDENGTINEASFSKAYGIDDFEKF